MSSWPFSSEVRKGFVMENIFRSVHNSRGSLGINNSTHNKTSIANNE